MAPITANYSCADGGKVINGAYSPPNALGCPGNPIAPVTANYPCPDGGSVVNGQYLAPGAVPGAQTQDVAPVSCHSDNGFSWLICGAVIAMVNVVDSIRDNIIAPFLEEKAVSQNDPTYAKAYQIWSAFRNVASIFFILVFFMVIIGTAAGFDNYTIKKVMPHLVAGAILVPFSWYFAAFIVDIGNVLGGGIVALVQSIGFDTKISLDSSFSAIFLGVGGTALFVLAGAAATIGFGVVASLLLAFLGVFVTLVLRKIFIILLLVISPFALLAWVLPNTSKWFKAWYENLFKLVMMYPIVMLLFEAGKIFSATAGAAVPANNAANAVTAAWVVPTLQIAGLILPLFAVPFAFKFAGKGLAMGSNAVGKVTGSLDKRFGKDSASAKVAAQNREFRNLQRAKALDQRIASATNPMEKARLQGAQRFYNRRAGYATPFNKKQSGFMSNPTALLAQEAAYGKVMGQQGILDANDNNKKDGVGGESHQQRREAEGLAAQQKKLADRAARQGLVSNASSLGPEELARQNRAILENGITNASESQAKKGGDAVKRAEQANVNPLTSHQISEHAGKMAEVDEANRRRVVQDEIEMSDVLDKEAMDAANAAAPPGAHISMQRAHEMRLQNLSRAAGRAAGNKMIGADIDATVSNEASDKLTQAEINRAAAAGEGTIDAGQALSNRLRQGMKAGIGQGTEHKIAEEAKDYVYNEMEHEAGGPLSAETIIAGTRLLNRQAMADNRSKLEGAVIAGTNDDGSDKVDSSEVMGASRSVNTKSFGDTLGATQGVLKAAATEAALDKVPLGSAAALSAAGDRSFKASSIEKARQLSAQAGSQQSVIKANAKAIQRYQREAARRGVGTTAADAQQQILSRTASAAAVSGYRSEAVKYAQDKMTVLDSVANPVSDDQVFAAAEFSEGRNVAAKTGTINANFNASRAEARTNHLVAGSEAAVTASLHTAARGAEITHTKNVSESVGKDKAAILADSIEHVSADSYIENTTDNTAEHLAEAAAIVNTEVEATQSLASAQGISTHALAAQVVQNAADKARMPAADKITKNISEAAGQAAGYREKVAAKAAQISATGGNPATAARAVLDDRVAAGSTVGTFAGEKDFVTTDEALTNTAAATEREIAAEEASVALYAPAGTDTRREAVKNLVHNAGTAAGLESGRKAAVDITQDKAKAQEFDLDVQKEVDGGATLAAADAIVRERRLANATSAEGSKTARQTRKQTRQEAGIAKDNARKVNKLVKKDFTPGRRDAEKLAAAQKQVLSDDLQAIGEDAAITSARANRVEVDKAKGTVDTEKASVEEAYRKMRKEQKVALRESGMSKANVQAVLNSNEASNRELAESNVFDKVQDDAGEAALIGAQDAESQLRGRDSGIVKENKENLDQAPVEEARNEAIRSKYLEEEQKLYDDAYNAAIANGLSRQDARTEAEKEKKNPTKLVEIRKVADAAGEIERKRAVENVKQGRVSDETKLRKKIVSVQKAAEEQQIRAEAQTQGSIIGMNQAATAPDALTAKERLESKSTAAAASLATESGNERGLLEMAGEGQTYHRSYATAEEAQTRAKQEQILRERVDQAGQKMVTFVKDGDTITDKISNVDLSNEAADEMDNQIRNYKALGLGPDDVAARIRSLGRSSYGADKLRGIKNAIFGGNRGRTVDPEEFDGQAKTIWDIGIAGINREGNPDLFVPEIASFDGINVEKLAKMNDRTKGVLMDYAEDMADTTKEVPGKAKDLATGKTTVARPDFAQNVGNSIADIFKNQNTSKNVSLKDLKAMAERMFVKDASGKYQTTVYNPNSAIVKHMLNIKDKAGTKLGEEALQIIADKLKDANLGI
ncbi:MAG: hypothetical protein NVSMB39_1640 [Candidatus Saccharimonadales bacterium]